MVTNIPFFYLSSIILSMIFSRVLVSEAIVKGQNAQPGEFPSIVSLRNATGGHYCAGTLVTRKHIVTAAHCLYDDLTVFLNHGTGEMLNPENIKVLVGTLSSNQGDGDLYEVEKLIQHPEYDIDASDSWINDIAVIVLKNEVNRNVVPTPASVVTPKDDASGDAAGWGTVSYNSELDPISQSDYPAVLQKLSVKIQDKETCAKKYGTDEVLSVALPLINSKYLLCALPVVNGAGMCVRDSGSPLIVDGEFVGISVAGVPCAKGFADLYALTAAQQDFIKGAINA